jgi:phosphate transport system permease protein
MYSAVVYCKVLVGVGLSNGQLLVFKPSYSVDVARDGKSKVVTPSIIFPYGSAPLTVNDNQAAFIGVCHS